MVSPERVAVKAYGVPPLPRAYRVMRNYADRSALAPMASIVVIAIVLIIAVVVGVVFVIRTRTMD